MRYIVRSAAAFALILSACDQTNTISGPDPSLNGRAPLFDAIVSKTNEMDIPWAYEQQNPCTGDYVTLNGDTHFIFIVTADGSGGYHINSQVDSKGTGLGVPSGFTYTAKDNFTDSQNTNGVEFSWTDERDVQVLGPRSVDNYLMHFVFKFTVTGTGVPSVVFDKPTTKCVG